MTPLERLCYWITERESIRIKKESGRPWPWTDDTILREWRFCNVNRCDDRETRWIFENIIAPHHQSSVLWFNLVIARFINWAPTLCDLGFVDPWDAVEFKRVIETIQERDLKIYTGAYMIPGGPKGIAKHDFLAQSVFGPLWDRRDDVPKGSTTWCVSWADFFRPTPGMGDFLINQVITDMKYTHHLKGAPDWNTFVLAGPGTQRGLNRLFGLQLSHKWDQLAAKKGLLKLREDLQAERVLIESPYIFDDLNNLSNCMCEYDKYCRVLFGEGTPRARYVPQ